MYRRSSFTYATPFCSVYAQVLVVVQQPEEQRGSWLIRLADSDTAVVSAQFQTRQVTGVAMTAVIHTLYFIILAGFIILCAKIEIIHKFTHLFSLSLQSYVRLSLTGGRRVFSLATKNMAPDYFRRKIKEKENQKKSLAVLFPTYLLYLPCNLKS